MITSGDLGVEPDDLEVKLREAFERAARWNAVLLLDEADVFLRERDVRKLSRNALVSVFLRELEYFSGIFFLTTNRPGQLDEAFQSRIHITINLPTLPHKSQLQIWLIFLQDQNLTTDEMKGIFDWLTENTKDDNLNGRQIRNTVRTAMALAAQDKRSSKLSTSHIQHVLDIGRDFTKYMKQLDNMDREEKAAALGLRVH